MCSTVIKCMLPLVGATRKQVGVGLALCMMVIAPTVAGDHGPGHEGKNKYEALRDDLADHDYWRVVWEWLCGRPDLQDVCRGLPYCPTDSRDGMTKIPVGSYAVGFSRDTEHVGVGVWENSGVTDGGGGALGVEEAEGGGCSSYVAL